MFSLKSLARCGREISIGAVAAVLVLGACAKPVVERPAPGVRIASATNRTVGVNTAIMLEALKTVYGADHLVKELTVVD